MNIETIHTPFHTNVLLYFHAFRSSVAKVTKQLFWNHTLAWVLSSTFAVFRSKSSERLFFLSRFSFTDTDNSQDSRGREGTIFFSTEPLPSAHEYSDIYLQLYTWDDYRIFLIATLVFTRLLLNEIYYLIELPFEWLMM